MAWRLSRKRFQALRRGISSALVELGGTCFNHRDTENTETARRDFRFNPLCNLRVLCVSVVNVYVLNPQVKFEIRSSVVRREHTTSARAVESWQKFKGFVYP